MHGTDHLEWPGNCTGLMETDDVVAPAANSCEWPASAI